MATLLIVTDHRFYSFEGCYYDNYVFNYDFFQPYLKVFNEIKLLVRVKNVIELEPNMQLSSGEKVSFIELEDFRRFELLFKIKKIVKSHQELIKSADAICFRLPSTIGNSVFKYVSSKMEIPYMFELIGDPEDSLNSPNDNFLNSFFKQKLSRHIKEQTKKIINRAICGSYVSFNHLQYKYPANSLAFTHSISSIRLDSSYILNEINNPLDIRELKIIHVGSFVEVKNQQLLVELTKLLVDEDFDVELTFIGDGLLIDSIKKLVKRYNLDKTISFKGQVTGFQNVVNELDTSNIFILPSLTEGMPRAMIEAMSRGLLCLGANRGGITELLPESHLFEPNNVQSAFEKLLTLINNPRLIEESRSANLKLAKTFELKRLQNKRIELLEFLKSQISN